MATDNLRQNDMEGRMTLYQLAAEWQRIEDELWESGGELTPELEAEMTETRESLVRKVDGYHSLYRKLGSVKDAASAEIERLMKIKRAADKAQSRLKDRLKWNMDVLGIDMLEGTLCKIGRRKSSRLNVDEDVMLSPYRDRIAALRAALPDYMTVEVGISKKAISDRFKGSDMLPAGCERVQNETIQIR